MQDQLKICFSEMNLNIVNLIMASWKRYVLYTRFYGLDVRCFHTFWNRKICIFGVDIFLIFIIISMWRNTQPKNLGRLSTLMKIDMLAGLLAEHPTLIKRPVIVKSDAVTVGWTKSVQAGFGL